MKTPFRWQASEYDCVPTTFVNALSFLFDREEIPPVVVQRVYLYCLDSISARREFGHGTSGFATALLANWLGEFRHKTFKVDAEVLDGATVGFGGGSKISECLNGGGVALLSVTHFGKHWHYILGMRVEDRWLYAFDPYPKSVRANKAGCFEFLPGSTGLHEPNLRIHYDWIDTSSDKSPFRLGVKSRRDCVLLRRQP